MDKDKMINAFIMTMGFLIGMVIGVGIATLIV